MLQIKFAFWTRLPHALLAIAHPDETMAQNSARRILGQWETLTPAERLAAHSVTKEFLEDTGVGGIRSLLVGFVQGRFSRTSQEFRPGVQGLRAEHLLRCLNGPLRAVRP